MANQIAPEGQIFVCAGCGKRSKDRYGEQRIDAGWDESCMLNAVLCYDSLSNGVYEAVDVAALSRPAVSQEG